MSVNIKRKDLSNIIMVGDRVLVKPKTPQDRTKSGLFLPPSIEKKERLHEGYVVNVGPGYPMPTISENNEAWKDNDNKLKFIPIQPQVGDLAIYLQNNSYEILLNEEKYYIVPNSAIFMLIRDEGLLK